jgi:alkaline phosphatase D
VRAAALATVVASLVATTGTSREAGPPFSYGVAAGEVTTNGALLWTRAPRAGRVVLQLREPRRGQVIQNASAGPANDFTVTVAVSGLRPATAYTYRFREGGSTSEWGHFTTAPLPTRGATVRFAVSGDADATPGENGRPAYNRFQVYARMAAEKNDFDINLGDTIYSDSEVAGSRPAMTLKEKWAKYKLGLALPALRAFRAATGTYSQWDDHEFVNDFSRAEFGNALYRAGVEAFTDYAPVRTGTDGLYRTVHWGKNIELFFLDERSFRSAKASTGGTCDVRGQPDLAPTAPPAVRQAFTLLVPSLADAVPGPCLARIDDPSRTMLGPRQLARFLRDLRRSTATFKVVVNEVPLMQFYALPYDRWEGYEVEREKVLNALRGVHNAVVLTTDTHADLVGDVHVKTFEPGGPQPSGVTEVVTGPVATNTFAKEIDAALGAKGTGNLLGAVFFKPQPPTGLGLRCVALDTYSYAEVTVTSSRLTIRLKGMNGQPVRDVLGAPCAPVVIRAR